MRIQKREVRLRRKHKPGACNVSDRTFALSSEGFQPVAIDRYMTEQEQIVQTALRYAVMKSPGFAAIALWCPYTIGGEGYVAATDGRSIRIGPGYFKYKPLEQAAIFVHEILHVALRHIPRCRKGRLDPLLWNLCTDAIINETIVQMPWLTLPEDGIRLHTLLTRQEIHQKPVHQWTSESLYAYLLQDKERLKELLLRFDPDLIGSMEGEGEPMEGRIWSERLMRARAGDAPGGLLRVVGHDFPTESIPWEKVLRRMMTQPLLPQTVPNWNRPSRRTLSLGADYFEPGSRPRDGLNLAGVVVDTSGSIHDTLLTRFAREIQGIQQRTGCEIYLISADAAVQTEQRVRNDGVSFRQKLTQGKIEFKGGGGTDFYPALQRMKEKKPRVVVYLTDLYGNFGEETRYPFPIIWASITKDLAAPFGTTLYLE